jgi:flagellar motor switch protein FliG
MFSKDPEERKRTAHRMSRSPDAENRTDLRKVEQVDLYDIILSHLLDGGYAETLEAAEAIMVNMSEEWREDIIESIGTGPFSPDDKEDPRYDPERLIKHYWNSRIFRSKRPDELPTRSKEDEKKQKEILRKMRRIDGK